MGKSTARKNYTTPRQSTPTHSQVKRQSKKVNRSKQTRAEAVSDAKAAALAGNPPNNDSIFDEGANT